MPRDRRAATRTISRSECEQHLRKAQEYVRSARIACDAGSADACAGNAVLATINAADAVAGILLGERWQGPHEGAAQHVARAGAAGVSVARQLRRVIRWKSRAHYDAVPMPAGESLNLLQAAERAVAIAERVIAGTV